MFRTCLDTDALYANNCFIGTLSSQIRIWTKTDTRRQGLKQTEVNAQNAPLPTTSCLGIPHLQQFVGTLYYNQLKKLTMSSAGPNNTLLPSPLSPHSPKLNDIMTHWTPFPLNSSAIAFPLARINLLLNVDAALIPAGKPVTFFVIRIPAGPSLKQNEGMPRRETGVVSPMHRPEGVQGLK